MHQLEYDNSIAHTDWGIVYHSLLCKDQTKDFKKPLNRIDCRRLVEIRRLRAAIQIVLSGVDETINKYQPTDWMATSFESHLTIEECLLKLTWSERIDVETHIAHYFSDILMEWNTLFPVDNETWENFGLGPRERNTFKELVLRWKQAEEQWVRLRLELSSDRVNAETFEATILGILDQGSITPLPLPEDKGFFARAGDEFKQVVSQLESNEGSLCKAFLEDIRDKIRSLVSESRRLSVPFNFPMATFGMMRVIGRKDVEAFNDIRNRVLFHIQSGATQPLSLAVFGPPGSGKSFGVTQIARDYGASMFEEINCNLSQGSDTSILDKTFVRVADAIATGKTPLVFFDEFDCGISGGETLSWLKYFLQPMQDGYYQHPDGRISAGNSKFIFAGGTHESYETFQEKIAKGEGKQEKLPDFVSRLKGFVNIPNVSPRQPTNRYVDKGPYVGNDSEEIPYLRRAMLIRSIINRKKMVRPFRNQLAGVGDVGIGLMDIDLLRAFLMVSRYRHGSRSITALLDIASPFYHAITKASMPSPEQLDMHTDALDFGLLLQDPIKDGKLSQVVTDKLLGGMAGANDSYVPMVSQFTTEITVYGANEVALRWDHGG